MFYCEECRLKMKWPKSLRYGTVFSHQGPCEVCEKIKECHDVHHSHLSILKKEEKNENIQKL